ncbi:MAG: SBBP repeat-containing protein, partial [Patescibacteria group bacterium]
TNFFIGYDQSKWYSNVPNYQGILARNVYPGIDLKYYGTNSQLEHDFIVSPGTDPKQILFAFAGQKELSLDGNGNLILALNDAKLTLQAPVSYQEVGDGGRKAIASSFELAEQNTVSIALGEYDASKTLVIDPTLSLIYSTYLGGSGSDVGFAITVDPSGNAYVTGQTDSTDFPISSPYQGANAGTNDAFISKLNATGSALVYSTYLGGTSTDYGTGIAADTSGNAYVTGYTDSSDFPTSSPYQASYGGLIDSFVTKLSADGSVLTYSTYLGGTTWSDIATGIVIDASGNAYVAGYTGSSDFPTVSAYQGSFGGGSSDAFVVQFNASGSTLLYATYLGGSANDSGRSLAVDAGSLIYLTGTTDSTDFPTNSPYQGSVGGLTDAFIVSLASNGSSPVYATYLGGSGNDLGYGIAVDSSSTAYVTGHTDSTDFPTSSPYQGSNNGADDVFVTAIDSTGATLPYSTYLGGSGTDMGRGIAVNASGNAYVTGETNSSDFPTSNAYQSTIGGSNDAFITKVSPSGSALTYSTYLGGTSNDQGAGIALHASGDAYVAGYTDSTDFPTNSPFQGSNAGGANDAFITQISENTVNLQATVDAYLNFTLSTTVCDMGHFSTTQTKFCTHTMSAATNAVGGYTISYIPTTTLTSGANTIDELTSQTSSVLASEQFGFNLKANTSAGSFTSANFGADPAGGTGAIMSGYELADQFQFATGGADIAQAAGPSLSTLFTASYIANITLVTEPGTYATPVIYNIVGSF